MELYNLPELYLSLGFLAVLLFGTGLCKYCLKKQVRKCRLAELHQASYQGEEL